LKRADPSVAARGCRVDCLSRYRILLTLKGKVRRRGEIYKESAKVASAALLLVGQGRLVFFSSLFNVSRA